MTPSILDTVRARISCRAYDGRPLSDKDRAVLTAYIQDETGNPFGLRVRLRIIDAGTEGKIGTYGMIAGAKSYLCGAVEKGEKGLVAYGYVVEKVILRATAMGIGTCWLGGTFNRSVFAQAIDLKEDEWLPAVTPVGYPREKGGFRDIIRTVTGAKKRKPWDELFFNENRDTPLTKEHAGEFADALEAVRLSPSAVNHQPWRVVRDDTGFHFYSAGKGGADPDRRHDQIDLGIALCHFELIARESSLRGGWVFADKGIPGLAYIASWDTIQA